MTTISTTAPAEIISNDMESDIPTTQKQLLLHGKGQPYQVHQGNPVPELKFGELLVEIHAIGLNPIDWKSAAFGFGLPQLPSLNGREFVGKIVDSKVAKECDLEKGEMVLAISTDYRDFRKAAFQEYAIVCCYHAIRIPSRYQVHAQVASVGVAYVAASIALGVCLGVSFTRANWKGPGRREFNLLDIAKRHPEDLPEDIVSEVLHGISPCSRPHTGEWILVYGASSVSGQIIIQLAKLVGLKVVAVASLEKHRALLASLGVDVLIDRTRLDDASRDLRKLVPAPLRFAIDTVGSDTALWCQNILASYAGSRHSSPNAETTRASPPSDIDDVKYRGEGSRLSHLIALSSGPKSECPNVQVHKVPIKLFHTNRSIGAHLSKWLYELLDTGALRLPDVELVCGGLDAVNTALERLKSGEISGKRLVVTVKGGSASSHDA